jgi:hypothetical protein
VQGIDQAAGELVASGQVGGDGLACGLVAEAEAEAAGHRRQAGAPGGDQQEQAEQAGDGDERAVRAPGQGLAQGLAGRAADDGGRERTMAVAHGDISWLSFLAELSLGTPLRLVLTLKLL